MQVYIKCCLSLAGTATSIIFVATRVCLLRQNACLSLQTCVYHDKIRFLSRQNKYFTRPPPLSPSLISLIVYVGVKHHESRRRRRKQQTKQNTHTHTHTHNKKEKQRKKKKTKKNKKKKKSTRAASAHEALA